MEKKIAKFVFATALLFIAVPSISCVEFGEVCDDNDASRTCDVTKPYACSLENPTTTENPIKKCGCLNRETMRYSNVSRTCVVNAEEHGCAEHISGGHQILIHCTANSYCDAPYTPPDQVGNCRCNNGFIKDEPYCKLGNGAGPCANAQDCSTSLVCTESKCVCPNTHVWDNTKTKCVGLVGANCTLTDQCSSNMECDASACKCLDGFTLHEGKCVHIYDGECQNDGDCHPDFPRCEIQTVGQPGKCKCAQDQEFNGGKCFILVGKSCNPLDDRCNTYSHCNETSSLCECFDGYLATGDHCKGKHGANCTSSPATDCSDDWNLQCNNDTKSCECKADFKVTTELGCLKDYQKDCATAAACHPDFPVCPAPPNNKCQCGEGLQYDDKISKCGIIPGNNCTSGEGEEDLCFTYSHCNQDTKVCECDPDYSHVENTCVGNLGADCTTSTDCKADSYLVCHDENKKCSCEPDYTEDGGKCKGGLEKPCIDNDNCLVGNCLSNNVCGCPDDTVVAGSQCESTYGGSCTSISCHGPYNLECDSTTNECICIEGKHYNPGKNLSMCLTGVGDDCVGNSDCVENGYCMQESASSYVCRCSNNFRPSEGLCVAGGGGDAMVKLPAFLTIILPVFIAIFSAKNQ